MNRTNLVYTGFVKNITLSADSDVIDRARLRAAKEKTTLNAVFREWLNRYASVERNGDQYAALMKRLQHVKTTRSFSREERNKR